MDRSRRPEKGRKQAAPPWHYWLFARVLIGLIFFEDTHLLKSRKPSGIMEDKQVQAQIKQMRNFIVQEAEEKASEIQSKAEEEAHIERMKIVDAAKEKFRKEFERRKAQSAIQRKMSGF